MKMKLIVIGLMVVLSAAVLLTACEKKAAAKTEAPAAAGQAVVYTCPMHPEVVSNVPGKCPKCGMNLVVKK
jgi:ABC-type oligopeptide transport system substrate-binding subunit